MEIEKRLSGLGLELPAPPTPAGNYIGWVQVGDLLFVGGNVGRLNGRPPEYAGKVGGDVTLEQAYAMARSCALNHLAVIRAALDFIWEVPGEDIPIEVKWTARPRPADARHLETFSTSSPDGPGAAS